MFCNVNCANLRPCTSYNHLMKWWSCTGSVTLAPGTVSSSDFVTKVHMKLKDSLLPVKLNWRCVQEHESMLWFLPGWIIGAPWYQTVLISVYRYICWQQLVEEIVLPGLSALSSTLKPFMARHHQMGATCTCTGPRSSPVEPSSSLGPGGRQLLFTDKTSLHGLKLVLVLVVSATSGQPLVLLLQAEATVD